MRIRPPGAQEDGLHGRPVFQICLEGGPHWDRIAFEVEMVLLRCYRNEFLHLREGIVRRNVDRL